MDFEWRIMEVGNWEVVLKTCETNLVNLLANELTQSIYKWLQMPHSRPFQDQ